MDLNLAHFKGSVGAGVYFLILQYPAGCRQTYAGYCTVHIVSGNRLRKQRLSERLFCKYPVDRDADSN